MAAPELSETERIRVEAFGLDKPEHTDAEPMTPYQFGRAIQLERYRQIEKGYTAAHDDERGTRHLINQAIDYARKGEPVASAAIILALSEHLERLSPVPQPDREALTQEERHELVDAAVKEMTPNFTNETAAWNAWNNLNTSPAFIAAFQYFHPLSPAPLTINGNAMFEAIADRLGEHERAYNEFDPSDEPVTCITLKAVPVETLAEFIMPAVIAHLSAQTVEGEVDDESVPLQAAYDDLKAEYAAFRVDMRSRTFQPILVDVTDAQVEAAFASILETARDVTTKDDIRAALEAAIGVRP